MSNMKEIVELHKDGFKPSEGALEIKNVLSKIQKIEAKEKCLRVQFLDWLSDKLLDWSNRVNVIAAKIESPCLIEVTPRKREDSKSYKESKQVERLKELLEIERSNRK